jgi:hypothetical protein
LALTENRITSPVRPVPAAGEIVSEEIVETMTVIGSVADAEPEVAVMVARPAVTAVSRPSDVTRATLGAELRQVMRSGR